MTNYLQGPVICRSRHRDCFRKYLFFSSRSNFFWILPGDLVCSPNRYHFSRSPFYVFTEQIPIFQEAFFEYQRIDRQFPNRYFSISFRWLLSNIVVMKSLTWTKNKVVSLTRFVHFVQKFYLISIISTKLQYDNILFIYYKQNSILNIISIYLYILQLVSNQ